MFLYACRFVPLLMAYPFGSYVGAFFCSQLRSSRFPSSLHRFLRFFWRKLRSLRSITGISVCRLKIRCKVWTLSGLVYWSIVHRDHVKFVAFLASTWGVWELGAVLLGAWGWAWSDAGFSMPKSLPQDTGSTLAKIDSCSLEICRSVCNYMHLAQGSSPWSYDVSRYCAPCLVTSL